eukprot:1161801-Pelagomonas_calceolata.AAC.7
MPALKGQVAVREQRACNACTQGPSSCAWTAGIGIPLIQLSCLKGRCIASAILPCWQMHCFSYPALRADALLQLSCPAGKCIASAILPCWQVHCFSYPALLASALLQLFCLSGRCSHTECLLLPFAESGGTEQKSWHVWTVDAND